MSFLELVRLGVKRFDDPAILNTLQVVDQRLKAGAFWHRFSFDGYGERRDGKSWRLFGEDTRRTLGRAWPIFAGERGEYELLAGRSAAAHLAAMAAAGNGGGMLPEQVWDGRAPTGKSGFPTGRGDLLGDPAGVDSRAARQARLVRRGRGSGGAPEDRLRPLLGRWELSAILPCRPRAGAGFSFDRRTKEPTTLGARLPWPAETSGSL